MKKFIKKIKDFLVSFPTKHPKICNALNWLSECFLIAFYVFLGYCIGRHGSQASNSPKNASRSVLRAQPNYDYQYYALSGSEYFLRSGNLLSLDAEVNSFVGIDVKNSVGSSTIRNITTDTNNDVIIDTNFDGDFYLGFGEYSNGAYQANLYCVPTNEFSTGSPSSWASIFYSQFGYYVDNHGLDVFDVWFFVDYDPFSSLVGVDFETGALCRLTSGLSLFGVDTYDYLSLNEVNSNISSSIPIELVQAIYSGVIITDINISGDGGSYQTGYNDGYQAGLDVSLQNSNNDVWALFQNVATSINGVFNVEIMPGISVWTLLFIPFVVIVLKALFAIVGA